MNAIEFDRWYGYHTGAFPGIKNWLRRQGDDGFRRNILEHWQRALSATEELAAMKATDRLRDREDLQPKAYEKHPAVVRRVAREFSTQGGPAAVNTYQPRIIDGEYVYDCPRCEDSGTVVVLNRDTMIALFEGETWEERGANRNTKGSLTTGTVACTCGAGEKFRRRMVEIPASNRKVPFPVFDKRDFEMKDACHWNFEKPPAGLAEHVAQHGQTLAL